ncbi:hypothetical protein GR160_02840 [Flavobacterium sp. Sd200]|uniref:hypothetical protein n=1 Tax=Flavobacterium sp. Sd200 TaxID=2692211 RepID=UPI00136D1F74|nr:hypothetical protein [Flavobacterium sp. Sd200]MXN90150.1 hypothetical protein [Flavobacterium sp. Sd200]
MKKFIYILIGLFTLTAFAQGGVTLPTGFNLQDDQPLDDRFRHNGSAGRAALHNAFTGVFSTDISDPENPKLYIKTSTGWINCITGVKGSYRNYAMTPGADFSATLALTALNSRTNLRAGTTPFVVAADESPLLLQFTVSSNVFGDTTLRKTYIFAFLGGAGSWGQGGTAVTAANLKLLSIQQTTVEDITNDPNTVTIPLGTLSDGNYLVAANSAVRNLSSSTSVYYFSYTQSGNLYMVQFVGTPGTYGGGGTQLVGSNLVPATNSTVQPVSTLQSVTEAGSTTTKPITIQDASITARKTELNAEGIKLTNSSGFTTTVTNATATGNATLNIQNAALKTGGNTWTGTQTGLNVATAITTSNTTAVTNEIYVNQQVNAALTSVSGVKVCDVTQYTDFTGTTTNTLIRTYFFPANSLSNGVLKIDGQFKVSGTGNRTVRIYASPTAAISGSSLCTIQASANGEGMIGLDRAFYLTGGRVYSLNFQGSRESFAPLGNYQSENWPLNTGMYIVVAYQLTVSADVMAQKYFKITYDKETVN